MTNAQTEARAIPEFIRPWTAPFHVTMDGIKDAKGCWVCSATNNKLAHQLVELMDYAATAATALATKNTELSDLQILLVSARQQAERAEAHLAEARKAQNYLNDAVFAGLDHLEIARRAKILVNAARRAREQGGENG